MAQFKKTDNGTWSYRVDIGINPITGKRKQKYKSGFRTKKEAALAAAAIERYMTNKTYVPDSKVTFAEFVDQWLKTYSLNLKISSIQTVTSCTRKIVSLLGYYKLQEINKPIYQSFLDKLVEEEYAYDTISNMHGFARMIFKQAKIYKIIYSDPTQDIKLPKKKKTLTLPMPKGRGFLVR